MVIYWAILLLLFLDFIFFKFSFPLVYKFSIPQTVNFYINSDNTMTIEITLIEGEPYNFGNITFVGNTIYTNEELKQQLERREKRKIQKTGPSA